MSASPVAKLTIDDYLAIDGASDRPLEFHDGEIYPMVDATANHSIIAANVARHFGNRLDGSNCRVLSVACIRATAKNVVYPDIAVVCGSILPAKDAPCSDRRKFRLLNHLLFQAYVLQYWQSTQHSLADRLALGNRIQPPYVC